MRLSDVARELFIASGYEATTVERIAASAGLTKGAVYFYFRSKANLLLSLLHEAESLTVRAAIAAVRGAGAGARDQLVAFLHSQSLAGQEHADRMLLIILMSIEFHGKGGPVEERLTAINGSMSELLCDVIETGKAQGVFTDRLPTREMASIVTAVNQGCFVEWYRRGDELDGEDLVRALRTTVLDGLVKNGAERKG